MPWMSRADVLQAYRAAAFISYGYLNFTRGAYL